MVSEPTLCQKPRCKNTGTETYTGENGNRLNLCSRHYYKLVSGNTSASITYDTGTDPIQLPFWDSGLRCDSTSDNEYLSREINDVGFDL